MKMQKLILPGNILSNKYKFSEGPLTLKKEKSSRYLEVKLRNINIGFTFL